MELEKIILTFEVYRKTKEKEKFYILTLNNQDDIVFRLKEGKK